MFLLKSCLRGKCALLTSDTSILVVNIIYNVESNRHSDQEPKDYTRSWDNL